MKSCFFVFYPLGIDYGLYVSVGKRKGARLFLSI